MRKFNCLILIVLFLIGLSSCERPERKKHTYETIPDAVTDVDGNHYDAVKIGDQVWMKQNLKTTRYADGTVIPPSTVSSDQTPLAKENPYRWAPGNVEMNVQKYGWLYNWMAVMRDSVGSDLNPSGVQGICPDGWHVPSHAEWIQLTDYVSSDRKMRCPASAEFAIAKALCAQTDWNYGVDKGDVGNDLSTNNATGFSVLPAGHASFDFGYQIGSIAYFWTSSYGINKMVYIRQFHCENDDVDETTWPIDAGLSVRCVKD